MGRPRVFASIAAAALAGTLLPAMARAADPELRATRASINPAGIIDLSLAGQLDWVKWGHPFPAFPAGRGPFGASSSPPAPARKRLPARLIGDLVTDHMPDLAAQPPPTMLWSLANGLGSTTFTWPAADGDTPLNRGESVNDGVQLLPSSSVLNFGWGFNFTVASSTRVRQLDIYLACQELRGDLTIAMGSVYTATPQTPICAGEEGTVKYSVIFAAPAEGYAPLIVGLFTEDGVPEQPIGLLAAALFEADTADGGAPDAAGATDATTADAAVPDAGADAAVGARDAAPDGPRLVRVMACAIGPGAPARPSAWALSGFAALLLAAARRHRR